MTIDYANIVESDVMQMSGTVESSIEVKAVASNDDQPVRPRYLYVNSLTYAFGWSAFLWIRFCDTLIVTFLCKHHHQGNEQ
jgi:hypothetical protein